MALSGDQWLLFIVRLVHILAGIVWVGGAAYMGLVVARSLNSTPPTVKGPAMGRIGPAGYKYLSWAGATTILFGILNQVLMMQTGRVPTDGALGFEWNLVLGIAFLVALTMMGIAGGVVGPTIKKMGAGPSPTDAAALQGRLKKATMANIGLGLTAVILMVYASSLF